MKRILLLGLLSTFSIAMEDTSIPIEHASIIIIKKPKTFHDLRKHQSIFAQHVGLLINFIYKCGYTCSLGEVYRPSEMAAFYAKEKKGILHSQHCLRLAIDIDLFSPQGLYLVNARDYAFLGTYWKSLDPLNRWGGDFTHGCIGDANHFERVEE